MRIASYRNKKFELYNIVKPETYSAGAGCVFFVVAVNQLIDKGKLIVRWGRKAIGSMDSFMDSLAAEVNGFFVSLFPPRLHCAPLLRSVRLIEKGERNDKIYS